MKPATARPKITVTADGRGGRVSCRDAPAGRACRPDRLDRHAWRRARPDPAAPVGARSGAGADGPEGDARRRRPWDQRPGGAADRPELFGTIASTATAWRVLDNIDSARLAAVRAARVVARERRVGATHRDRRADSGLVGGPAGSGRACGWSSTRPW